MTSLDTRCFQTASPVGDLFKDSDNSEPPAELTEYEPEVKLDILWDKSDGDGTDELALNLVPAVAEGRVIIADHDGLIQARSLLIRFIP
jgi:outer membrane protein assembly factor BamB